MAGQVEGMWPYWLDGAAPSTVRNSFAMNSMLLLTGDDPLWLHNHGSEAR